MGTPEDIVMRVLCVGLVELEGRQDILPSYRITVYLALLSIGKVFNGQ